MNRILERAREIADDVLFPATLDVERTGVVPASHLDLLAEAGFYGLLAPPGSGGPGLEPDQACRVLETLASGCLCTTFVWMQHNGVVTRLAGAGSSALRTEWLPRLVSGRSRAGVALGGTLPGPARLTATPTTDGYVLSGSSPWVTGWGMADVLLVAARDGDTVVWSLVDAKETESLSVEALRLVAVSASNTVTVTFTGHVVPAERIVATQPYAEWAAADAAGLRMNGSLALGLTSRCTTLLGPTALDAALDATRTRLDTASVADMPAARAAASALAARAANALVAHAGSTAVLPDQHPQKLARESLFLLVFASRPAIKTALAARLLD